MAHSVEYILNIVANNTAVIDRMGGQINRLAERTDGAGAALKKLGGLAAAYFGVSRVADYIRTSVAAYEEEMVASAKLAQVMRNTMNATDGQIESIKELASVQQKLGVIGDETQLAGAQELGTYLTQADGLKKLMPVMNDMLAQQYGLNATQEQAVTIAQMMGKVLDGQTGALSRYGYRFDEAQEKVLKYGSEQQRVAMLSQVITQYVGGMNAALAATPEGRLKQAANRMGDIQERVGGIWIAVKSAFLPAVESVGSMIEKLADWFEANREKILAAVNTVANTLVTALGMAGSAVKWVVENLSGAIATTGVFILAYKTATVSISMFSAVSSSLGVVIRIVRIGTMSWVAAQRVLNNVMKVNPVALVIAGITALVAAIAWVVYKTDGWGRQWEAVVNFMKYTFMTYVESIKLYFGTMINGLLNGLDHIKIAWYRFQEIIGRADNSTVISQISRDIDERVNAIKGGAGKVAEYAQKARDALKWELSWNRDKSFSDIAGGLKAKLGIAAPPAGSNGTGITAPPPAGGNGGGGEVRNTAEGIVTGGSRSTNINITIGNVVEKMTFAAADMKQNMQDMRDEVLDTLLRVINMSQSAAQ
jgi:hypothetical protein